MASNEGDIYLRDEENSNGGGDRSAYDEKNSTNQRGNDEEELGRSRIENLLLDDSDDELTEHHGGADGALAQPIKTNQESNKSAHTFSIPV